MKNISVEYPGIRLGLIDEVKVLTDKQLHLRQWTTGKGNLCFWGNFDLYTETLIDSMPCEEDPPRSIGVVLRNYEELVYVQFLIQCLQRVIKEIGIKQPDSAYLNSPLWDDVVEAAKHAYEVLMKDEDLDALLEAEEKRVVT